MGSLFRRNFPEVLPSIYEMLEFKSPVSLNEIRFRDPSDFTAGGIHDNVSFWEDILTDHPQRDTIYCWIKDRVNASDFIQPFKGVFKGCSYESDSPLERFSKITFRVNNLPTL